MSMFRIFRRGQLALALLGAALSAPLAMVCAQDEAGPAPFNERTVAPELNVFDKDGIYTMHFRFKNPRVITADVPGRGKKIVWYMWYQVINRTGEPRMFIPQFELVVLDGKNGRSVHMDEVEPSVQKVIERIEDPTGRLKIKNSVTIGHEPIPPSQPDSAPRAVTGVAIWTGVYDAAPDMNSFSIFVSGLSDGITEDDNGVIRRKTLQLNFRRIGDADRFDAGAVRFLDNPQWIYRASEAKPKGTPPAGTAPAPNEGQ